MIFQCIIENKLFGTSWRGLYSTEKCQLRKVGRGVSLYRYWVLTSSSRRGLDCRSRPLTACRGTTHPGQPVTRTACCEELIFRISQNNPIPKSEQNDHRKNNAWVLLPLVNLQHCMHCFINSSSSRQEIFVDAVVHWNPRILVICKSLRFRHFQKLKTIFDSPKQF